jgi:hypothetical protein
MTHTVKDKDVSDARGIEHDSASFFFSYMHKGYVLRLNYYRAKRRRITY